MWDSLHVHGQPQGLAWRDPGDSLTVLLPFIGYIRRHLRKIILASFSVHTSSLDDLENRLLRGWDMSTIECLLFLTLDPIDLMFIKSWKLVWHRSLFWDTWFLLKCSETSLTIYDYWMLNMWVLWMGLYCVFKIHTVFYKINIKVAMTRSLIILCHYMLKCFRYPELKKCIVKINITWISSLSVV